MIFKIEDIEIKLEIGKGVITIGEFGYPFYEPNVLTERLCRRGYSMNTIMEVESFVKENWIPEKPVVSLDSNVMCKGSIALNSGCGMCESCLESWMKLYGDLE